MLEVNPKTIFFLQRSFHRTENVLIALYGIAAFTAYQMVVMSFLGVMIDDTVIGFALEYTLMLFQEIQRAINSRFVDMRVFSMNMVNNFLSREMIALVVDIVQNHPAWLS